MAYFRFTKIGTYKIDVTFIQPSSKLLTIELKCPIVTIVENLKQTCFRDQQQFHLISSNSINNTSSILLLPFSLQHNLQPIIINKCSTHDFLYSYYLLSIDPIQWKYSRTQRYTNSLSQSFQETFLENYCSELGSKSILTIEPKTLSYGYYIAVFTVSMNSNPSDFRQFIQPIEIIRSDLITTFNGNQTIVNDQEEIHLNFYSTTYDPDQNDFDRRKLNFTLICYPKSRQELIFQPNLIQLGSSRPTEINPQNLNHWIIQWSKLNLIFRRLELNLQVYENQCLTSNGIIKFNSTTQILNINEHDLLLNNETIYFLLIIRHLTDGRQLIARFEVNKQLNLVFDTTDLTALEEVMGNLDDLAVANPKKAMEFITGLADKLNEMSENSVSESI